MDSSDPPLRAIISFADTANHSRAQYLSGTLRPYLIAKFIVRSSDEFLVILNELTIATTEALVSH